MTRQMLEYETVADIQQFWADKDASFRQRAPEIVACGIGAATMGAIGVGSLAACRFEDISLAVPTGGMRAAEVTLIDASQYSQELFAVGVTSVAGGIVLAGAWGIGKLIQRRQAKKVN